MKYEFVAVNSSQGEISTLGCQHLTVNTPQGEKHIYGEYQLLTVDTPQGESTS